MGGGGKTSTTTQQVSIPPEVMARYNAVNARAESVSNTPFQQYSTDPSAFVAPLTATQRAGISGINASAQQAQPYYGAATEQLLSAQGMGQQGLAQAGQTVGQAQQVGQALGGQAYQGISSAPTIAAPYYGQAERILSNATGMGQAGLGAAGQYALAGSQAVSPQQFSGQAVGQYMSPFLSNVVGQTMAAQAQQNAQQRRALQGEAIKAGAFGGDRSGIAQANLAYQQNLANQQTLANLLQGGYGQALGAFQQQQGVNLAADQANRAALQQTGQSLGQLAQQGYGMGAGTAQQLAGYGQNLAGLGLQTGQAVAGLGQQQFGQGMTTAQQQAALAQQGYGMGAGTAQALAGLGTGAQGAALQGAQAQLGAGQMQQQTEQAGLQALYNQFLQEKGYPFQVAQFLANIAMGTGALSGSTTTTTQPAPFFSDERVKDNVEPIGKTFDGQNIVKFNYKGSPQKQIGLIAQEVEERHPDAVGLAGGIKTVDYDAATREAAERGRDSEGGAVTPMRAGLGYARGGYARGGSSAFDQDFVAQLLANQQGQYAQMYGQAGMPRGVQGTPGMTSRVPNASLPVGRLATAGSAPQQQSSGMAQGLSAARQGAEIASMLKQGKEGLKYVTGGVDEKGNKIPSLADRARAFGQPEQGPQMPSSTTGGTTTTTTTPAPVTAPRAEMEAPGVGGGKIAVSDLGLGGGKIDVEDTEKLAEGLGSLLANRGGRMTMALGGGAEEDISAPEGMYTPTGLGLNIPDDTPKNLKGPEAAKAPSQSGKGAGDYILDAAKLAAMVLLKDGGAVKGYADGGLTDREDLKAGLVPLTGEVLPPVEKPRPEGLAVMASRDTGATSDARPTGFGGTTPNETGTGVVAPKPSAFDTSVKRTFQFEGHINPRDTNGTPSVYGINQKANPDIDVKSLTPEKARDIYKTRYWDAIGADSMDPKLAHVAFDTAVIAGPDKAKQMVAQAEGDPVKLMEIRQSFLNGLVAKDPEKYGKYAKAWENRHNVLMNDITEGVSAGARAPGVAGPGRGPQTAYNAPYSTLMNKILPSDTSRETRDIATSENLWVPLLAGVGTMLSTKSPYLGTAIGEGLVGATGAYTGLQKQQADIAQTQASTEQTFANIVKDAIKVENGRVFIRAVGPQGYYFLPFNEWWALDPKDRPKLDPRVESYVSDMAPVLLQADQAGAAKAKPATAPVGTTTAPATAPATPAAPGTQPVSPGAPVAPAATPAPAATSKPAEVRTSVFVSPQQASEAKQITYNKSGWSQQELDKEPDYFKPQDEIAKAVTNQMQILTPLAGTLASLPTKGSIYTSGKLQEVANPVMSVLNNLAAAAGNPSLISDPKQLTNQEEVKKLVNQLQQAATSDTQQRAFAAFREMAEGLPSLLTSPGGQARLMPQILAASQRELDRNNFFVDWAKAAGGDKGRFAEWAKYSSREANRAFDGEYNNAFYARERDALERMFKDKIRGTDTSVLAHVAMNAASLTPKQKESIRKEYGDRILRYFGVQ